MTEWTTIVRHIPDPELHAYLDQALSRSQCVEIERHLAHCPRCQSLRDDIAALRDRTTALLARTGPPPIVPPLYDTLRIRHAARLRVRWRRLVAGAWAASVAGAAFIGWQLNHQVHGGTPSLPLPPETIVQVPLREAPAPLSAARPILAGREEGARGLEPVRVPRVRRAEDPTSPVRFANTLETDPDTLFVATAAEAMVPGAMPADVPDLIAQPVSAEPGLQGIWRTIVPDNGQAAQPADIPRVPGLIVLQMRVQPGTGGSDVTAVDQLLESGEVIRTIAGPAAQVGALVVDDTTGEASRSGEGTQSIMTVTIRQGDRMVAVTGPSQALGSLLSRVDVKRRRY
jgi:hypothetical protein